MKMLFSFFESLIDKLESMNTQPPPVQGGIISFVGYKSQFRNRELFTIHRSGSSEIQDLRGLRSLE